MLPCTVLQVYLANSSLGLHGAIASWQCMCEHCTCGRRRLGRGLCRNNGNRLDLDVKMWMA